MSKIICLAGLPGSGKTTWAKDYLKYYPDILYFSPDEYYERINGDDCDRSNSFEVWMAMFRDIHTAELAGRDVLIDSDNLTYAQRNQWIEWFPGFNQRELFYFDEPLEDCVKRMMQRRRKIPIKTMREKAAKWQNPYFNVDDRIEWDSIRQIPFVEDKNEK